jgi:hypothetical protein
VVDLTAFLSERSWKHTEDDSYLSATLESALDPEGCCLATML